MGILIAIFIASCWIFLIAIFCGFSDVEGILTFIGVFWVVFICGCLIYGYNKSAKENKENLNDLQISSYKDGVDKALSIINKLQWTPTGSMQSRERRYITFRFSQNDINDFDWLVKYISHSGCHADFLDPDYKYDKYVAQEIVNNPHALMAASIGDSLFKCRKVNSDFTVTEIYRIPKSEEERKLIEASRFSNVAPKTKSLADAMYMHMKTNPIEPTFESALDSLTKFAENNKNSFGDTPKSSKLNQTGIVEDIQEEVAVSQIMNDEQKDAIRILDEQNWEQINNAPDGRMQYCSRKQFAPDSDDFKWVVN